MVSHRFIPCTVPIAVRSAVRLHQRARIDGAETDRHVRLCWSSALPGHEVHWTLDLEQGANGVLAHLAVEPSRGSLTGLTLRWRRLALHPLCTRRLSKIAEQALIVDI